MLKIVAKDMCGFVVQRSGIAFDFFASRFHNEFAGMRM